MRCPVCKVENEQGPLCRRCKADLSLLFQVEKQRARHCSAARRFLRNGRWDEAIGQAAKADGLRHDDESLRLAAIGCLMARDFDGALRYYRMIAKTSAV